MTRSLPPTLARLTPLSPAHPPVPLDSGYLSNSPFMLNVPHAQTGLTTVGLQCSVPQPSLSSSSRITVTPAAVPGYSLKLGLTPAGMETSFTYSLNSAVDPNFAALGGWAQPEVDIANTASPSNDYKTDFFTFLGIRRVFADDSTTAAPLRDATADGIPCPLPHTPLFPAPPCHPSLPSPLGTFTDGNNTAIINGYPHLFLPCNQIAVNTSLLTQAAGNYAALPLYALLWTMTPANVVSTCTAFNAATLSSGTVAAPLGTVALDFGLNYSPFGGRTAAVVEVASAPHIAFIPGSCTGAGCSFPFPGSTFNVSAPVNASTWTSSPSCTGSGGVYTSTYQGTAVTTVVTAAPLPTPPPGPPSSTPFPVTIKGAVAWLAVLTIVFSLWLIGSLSAWVVKTVGAAKEQVQAASSSAKDVTEEV